MTSESETAPTSSSSESSDSKSGDSKSSDSPSGDSASGATNGSSQKPADKAEASDSVQNGDSANHSAQSVIDALNDHMAISGTEDSTAAAAESLSQLLLKENIPFLLIDDDSPVIRRIAPELIGTGQIKLFRGGKKMQFAVNPLELLPDVAIESHILNLVEIFRRHFELDRSAAFVLEIALEKVYERSGWTVLTDKNRRCRKLGVDSDTTSGDTDSSATTTAANSAKATASDKAATPGAELVPDSTDEEFYQPEIHPTLHELVEVLHALAAANELPVENLTETISKLLRIINPLITGTRDLVFGLRSRGSIAGLFQFSGYIDFKSLPSDRERSFCLSLLLSFAAEYFGTVERAESARQPNLVILVSDSNFSPSSETGSLSFTDLRRLHSANVSLVSLRSNGTNSSGRKPLSVSNRLITSRPNDERLERMARFSGSDATEKARLLKKNDVLLMSSGAETAFTFTLESLLSGQSSSAGTKRNGSNGTNGEPKSGEATSTGIDTAGGIPTKLIMEGSGRPLIAFGAPYCPEAFTIDAYALGWKVANTPGFQRVFAQYIFSVISDMAQLVHFRTKVMGEIHAAAGREHGLPTHYVSWSALSLITDKYYEDRAVRLNWSLAEQRRVRGTWYEMIAPAFLPSIPNRKLNVKIIKNWMDDFVALHNREAVAAQTPVQNTPVFLHDIDKFIDNQTIESVTEFLSAPDPVDSLVRFSNQVSVDLTTKENKELALCFVLRLLEYLPLNATEREDLGSRLRKSF